MGSIAQLRPPLTERQAAIHAIALSLCTPEFAFNSYGVSRSMYEDILSELSSRDLHVRRIVAEELALELSQLLEESVTGRPHPSGSYSFGTYCAPVRLVTVRANKIDADRPFRADVPKTRRLASVLPLNHS